MIMAALINVGLDLLFVAVFGWGVLGAAIATVIAQGFSAAYCLSVLRHIPDVRLTREDFHQQPAMSLRLLKLAAPLAIQNVIISVGGLTVQYVAVSYTHLIRNGGDVADLEIDKGSCSCDRLFQRIPYIVVQYQYSGLG